MSALPCSKSDHELFAYTSGRYLYNEKLRLAERHVPFDVVALKNIAANSVGRRHVTHMKKFAEGGFNRVFLLTMNDGFEVIVKIPYSLTVPKRFTTESEVATLDFLYSKGLPVPRVYAWSSGTDNVVGAEYIIMEKAQGHPLESRWFSLTPKERVRLVTSYVEIKRKMFSLPLVSMEACTTRAVCLRTYKPTFTYLRRLTKMMIAVGFASARLLTICFGMGGVHNWT